MKPSCQFLLWVALGICMPANAQELQTAERFRMPDQNWPRGRVEFSSLKTDHRMIEDFDEPALALKWVIVSGQIEGTVDRVRARFLFNNKKWINLYANKTAQGEYEWGVVKIHRIVQSRNGNTILESDSGGPAKPISTANPDDIRIVDWDHDKLIVQFNYGESFQENTGIAKNLDLENAANGIEQELPNIFFRFDLSLDQDR